MFRKSRAEQMDNKSQLERRRNKIGNLFQWLMGLILLGLGAYAIYIGEEKKEMFLSNMEVGKVYHLDNAPLESEYIVTHIAENKVYGDLILILREEVDPGSFSVQRFQDNHGQIDSCSFIVSYFSNGDFRNPSWEQCPTLYSYAPVEIAVIDYRIEK